MQFSEGGYNEFVKIVRFFQEPVLREILEEMNDIFPISQFDVMFSMPYAPEPVGVLDLFPKGKNWENIQISEDGIRFIIRAKPEEWIRFIPLVSNYGKFLSHTWIMEDGIKTHNAYEPASHFENPAKFFDPDGQGGYGTDIVLTRSYKGASEIAGAIMNVIKGF